MLSTREALVNLRSGRFVLLIVVFVAISAIVNSGIINDVDEYAVAALADARNPSMDALMIAITTSADLFPVYLSPMIIFSFILIIRRKTRRVGSILLITLAAATLMTTYVKDIVDRERPTYEFKPDLGFDYSPEIDAISRFTSSFPSGHATRSAAFALIISFMIRNRTIFGLPAGMLMWALPVSIAFSRVYMGMHYPTDVMAGIVFGIIIANVFSKILKIDPEMRSRV